MSRVLIDSNAYSRFISGNRAVAEALNAAGSVLMSVFVLGELLAGFKAGARESKNREVLAAFMNKPSVRFLPAGEDTADYFGRIWAALRAAGRPIPINDIWVAAQALETGSVLITYDAHFAEIQGLRLWDAPRGFD